MIHVTVKYLNKTLTALHNTDEYSFLLLGLQSIIMLKNLSKITVRLSFLFGIISIGIFLVFLMVQDEVKQIEFLSDYKPDTSSYLYDKNLNRIKEIYWEKRYFIAIEKIPKQLINAFIAAEDKHFFEHYGIDFPGMIRAAFENTAKGTWKKRPVGASTITQQVAKNMVVGNKHSFERKIHEAVAGLAMEYKLSKKRILELYLNEIFLGHKSYGVGAAALTYFNKSLSQLSISECAYLASLPKAPGNFSSLTYKKRLLERKNWVLKRMYEDGYITKKQLKKELTDTLEKISIYKKKKNQLDYFSEHVRRDLLEQFGEADLYGKGLHIRTTQDVYLQKICELKLKKHLLHMDKEQGYRGPLVQIDLTQEQHIPITDIDWKKSPLLETLQQMNTDDVNPLWQIAIILEVKKEHVLLGLQNGTTTKMPFAQSIWAKKIYQQSYLKQHLYEIFTPGDVVYIEMRNNKAYLQQIPEITGGIIIMNPETGAILALAGGYDPSSSHYNTVTQGYRQPGSCFKPFVYMAALEKGFKPDSIIDDSPMEFYLGPQLGYYRPQNITRISYGPTPLQEGLIHSRNQMTVNLAYKIGMHSIGDLAIRFGIYERNLNELSAALGSVETTLLKLTSAYAMIANHGKKITPHSIKIIQDNTGKLIYEAPIDFYSFYQSDNSDNNDQNYEKEHVCFYDERQQLTQRKYADHISDFLKTAVDIGTAKRLKETCAKKSIEFCAKTGTTNDCKDGWCIGFTRKLKQNFVIGVFIGYPTPCSMGEKATGARTALPLIKDVLDILPKQYLEQEVKS